MGLRNVHSIHVCMCTGLNNLISSLIGAGNLGNTAAAPDRGMDVVGGVILKEAISYCVLKKLTRCTSIFSCVHPQRETLSVR